MAGHAIQLLSTCLGVMLERGSFGEASGTCDERHFA
jgi:hypothetical protein